jgi:CP family cyanate transporter-like MFS transporter
LLPGAGIVAMALSSRAAMTAASPLFGPLRAELGFTTAMTVGYSAAAPLMFAAVGIVLGLFVEVRRPDILAAGALLLIAIALTIRSSASTGSMFLAATLAALAGMGVVNVALPPLARAWFPHAIARVTAVYAAVIALSSALPPIVSSLLADAGWRTALLPWTAVALLGAVPLLLLVLLSRRGWSTHVAPEHAPLPRGDQRAMVRHALRIGVVFGMSAGNAFALFVWLPTLAHHALGLDDRAAAVLLAVYSAMALPVAVLTPWLVSRVRRPEIVGTVGTLCLCLGGVVLPLVPPPLAIPAAIVAGAGQCLYPLCLIVIARAPASLGPATALSSLGQGIGYLVGALVAVVMTVMIASTGSWTVTMLATAALTACGYPVMLALICGHRDEHAGS